MKIAIQARDFELTDSLREHVEYRSGFALSQFQDRIRGVAVRLSDVNGSTGGIDKRCHLAVRLNGLSDIVVQETESDFTVAVNRAADRAKRTLVRRLLRLGDTFLMNGLREVVMRRPLHEHRFSVRAVSALRKVRARTRLILGAAVLGILELPGLWIGPQGARHTREAGRP